MSMSRGADELTTMLAVLTAGAAYVPLDPSQPQDRLSMILQDARPVLMIAKRGHRMPGGVPDVRTVFLDDERPRLARYAGAPGAVEIDSSATAYVLFTSGSTGRPKGVEISRGAMSNLLASTARSPGQRESDVLLAVSTTMFDIAVLEQFGPLYAGATVHIADSATARDGRLLRALLEREPITVMQATPTTWRMLVDAGWHGDDRLRMLVGGEALTPELARRLLPHGELWNMYGPTETTVWSAIKRIDDADDITIGRPIDHTQLYVLRDGDRLAPPGVTGELCIGGAGVARGYLDRPDLTVARFVQNPYGPPGDRIYRTGDLARLRASGEFECLGRLDHQVKIRGFRVELGEIECRLDELACVGKCVVTLHAPDDSEPRLVAYVIPAAGEDFSPREMTRLLRGSLPSYMIPSQYIRMESFALTPSAKIDRGSLPDPADVPSHPETVRPSTPQTPTERTLLDIWTRVLGRTDIGLDDEFLDLGGHSLSAVRIFDEIHRRLRVDLPLGTLFEAPTVATLAGHIDALGTLRASPRWTTVVPIRPHGQLPPIFCVSGVGGNPMAFVAIAAALGDDQPFYGLQHRGVDGNLRPHKSIRAMAQQFVDDVRAAHPGGPYILAGYSGGGLAAYEMAQLLAGDGQQVDLLVLFDTVNPVLTGWSQSERAGEHWANLRAVGPRYVAARGVARIGKGLEACSARIRADLGERGWYRYRMHAVTRAGLSAQKAYRPQLYQGDVLLVRSDPSLNANGGIGYKTDGFNGWRNYVRGRLEVVTVPAGHLDMMDGSAARLAADELRRALRTPAPAQLTTRR